VVPDGSVERLAETLHEIITLPAAQLDAMRKACVERAEEYSVDVMVRAYTCFYRRLARSAAEPRQWERLRSQPTD
jgi:glycosyltransferase involved in cell wall biosynthesis